MSATHAKRWILILTAACSGSAFADASTDDRLASLFELRGLPAPSKEARETAARVVRDCSYSEFSRIGPRPAERARCQRAEEALIARGTDGALAALGNLGRPDATRSSDSRLFDVVGRAGDLRVAEVLVGGLAKLEAMSAYERRMEGFQASAAIRSITYAALGERAPWVRRAPEVPTAQAWRAFLDAHRGATREQLRAERVAAARQQLDGKDVEAIYLAASFLAQHDDTRADARSALSSLAERKDLPADARPYVAALLQTATIGPRKA